jgi:archaellum component FlaC
MSLSDRIDSIEQELEFVQHYHRWIPEAIASSKQEITWLKEKVKTLEKKLAAQSSGSSIS